jgi:hypothetical protein
LLPDSVISNAGDHLTPNSNTSMTASPHKSFGFKARHYA